MFPVVIASDNDRLRSGITWFNPLAVPLFDRALGRGRRSRLIARLMGHSRRLLVLHEVLSPDMIDEAPPAETQIVELEAIRGSVNRAEEFDRDFLPLDERLQNRWVRIASMMLQGATMAPVELVRVKRDYFVVDGHHRISVARALRYVTVDAHISRAYD